MKRWQWWAAGLIAYAAILVTMAPASILDLIASRFSGGRFRIAAADGTLWSGAGELQLFDTARNYAVGKRVAWRISPWSVLGGSLHCAIAFDGNPNRWIVRLAPSRVEISNADVSLPAAVLAVAEPRLAPFALGGELELRISELMLGRTGAEGNAVVLWRRASSAHSKVAPLGDYELRFASNPSAATFQLQTIQGALQLDGAGTWPRSGKPEFRANAHALPQYREQLEPFLRMIASDRGAGNYELQLK